MRKVHLSGFSFWSWQCLTHINISFHAQNIYCIFGQVTLFEWSLRSSLAMEIQPHFKSTTYLLGNLYEENLCITKSKADNASTILITVFMFKIILYFWKVAFFEWSIRFSLGMELQPHFKFTTYLVLSMYHRRYICISTQESMYQMIHRLFNSDSNTKRWFRVERNGPRTRASGKQIFGLQMTPRRTRALVTLFAVLGDGMKYNTVFQAEMSALDKCVRNFVNRNVRIYSSL